MIYFNLIFFSINYIMDSKDINNFSDLTINDQPINFLNNETTNDYILKIGNTNDWFYCQICKKNTLISFFHCKICNQCVETKNHNFCDRCNKCSFNTYEHCDACNICVPKGLKHCDKCNTCIQSNYIHCDKCKACFNLKYKHCDKCDLCHFFQYACDE